MKTNKPADKKSDIKLLVFISFLALLFFKIDLMTELGVADGVLYVAVVLLAQNLSQRRYIVILATISSALTVLGFFLSPPGGELWKVFANRFLAIYAIWITAILLLQRKKIEMEREKVIIELQDALAKVKQLSGLLPICSYCKKIRDDKGYWQQLESYITEHSETLLSHGMCPDCEKKAYEELEKWKNDMGKQQEKR